MRDPDITLSAGPTMAYPEVLAAQGRQITYHYDPAFIELFRRTERKVGRALPDAERHPAHAGRGGARARGRGRGLVQPGTPVLNLVSGVFGKGMGYWLKDFGAELHELEVPYNDSVDPADVERYLDEHPEIEVLTVVHCETPSGTLSDVAAIGPMAQVRGVLTIVDCVSSLGGIEFRTDDWQIDIAVAAAQKCLGGPPGITLMTVSGAAWERIRANPSAPRASFLSMLDWKEQWIDGEKFPFTPSVVDMHGIEACVDVVLAEGLDASIARHELCGRAARAGRARHGPRALAAQRGGHGGLRHGDRGARTA